MKDEKRGRAPVGFHPCPLTFNLSHADRKRALRIKLPAEAGSPAGARGGEVSGKLVQVLGKEDPPLARGFGDSGLFAGEDGLEAVAAASAAASASTVAASTTAAVAASATPPAAAVAAPATAAAAAATVLAGTGFV